jgi:hypothetical protein
VSSCDEKQSEARSSLTRRKGGGEGLASRQGWTRKSHDMDTQALSVCTKRLEGGNLHETRTVAIVSVRDVMLTTLRNVHAHKRCVICLCGWGNPCSWVTKCPTVCLKCVDAKNCLFVVFLLLIEKML